MRPDSLGNLVRPDSLGNLVRPDNLGNLVRLDNLGNLVRLDNLVSLALRLRQLLPVRRYILADLISALDRPKQGLCSICTDARQAAHTKYRRRCFLRKEDWRM